ncbi:MAG: hypothetical protein EXS13_11980 [Planctomycetes bacterium]|nr:hypothetical protein [Planctomycetota bacterium]
MRRDPMKLKVGLSTCPNDTFAFHGLLTGTTPRFGLEFEFVLQDIQQLNESLARGDLAIGKASFFQALSLTREFGVLPVGAALGFGVGPLLIAREPGPRPDARARLLAPGAGTTANALLRLLLPEVRDVRHVPFAAIMPALARGEADGGVVIHEGRFTYQALGLHCRVDLGAEYERTQRAPLPLGGLLARRDLGADVHARFTAALRASLAAARSDRDATFATMQRHAQELSPSAIWQHVELYVNDWTTALGTRGAESLLRFEQALRGAGLAARDLPPLELLCE